MSTQAECPTCQELRKIPEQWNPEHDECFRCWIGEGPAVHYPYGGRQRFKDRSIRAEREQIEAAARRAGVKDLRTPEDSGSGARWV